jgi:hypothetical protein
MFLEEERIAEKDSYDMATLCRESSLLRFCRSFAHHISVKCAFRPNAHFGQMRISPSSKLCTISRFSEQMKKRKSEERRKFGSIIISFFPTFLAP